MKKNNKFMIIIYIIILSFILSFLIIKYISNRYGKSFISYGEAEARRVVSLVINNCISFDSYDNLLVINKNNGKISSIDLDTYKVNKLVDKVNYEVSNNLVSIFNGNGLEIELSSLSDIDYNNFNNGFVYSIPMGSLIGNGLISNLGPNIPIKMILIGDVFSTINGNVKEYGINNALIEVSINIKVNVMVSMLFVSKKIEIDTKRVIVMKILQGEIPNYYFDKKYL